MSSMQWCKWWKYQHLMWSMWCDIYRSVVLQAVRQSVACVIVWLGAQCQTEEDWTQNPDNTWRRGNGWTWEQRRRPQWHFAVLATESWDDFCCRNNRLKHFVSLWETISIIGRQHSLGCKYTVSSSLQSPFVWDAETFLILLLFSFSNWQ